jgi:cobalt-precorrin 5A hydrolase / precorrin-3B C17-methyltransferase
MAPIWIGVGCQRGCPRSLIEQAIAQVCQTHRIPASAIAGIATIDRKAEELEDYCRDRHLLLRTFTADQLSQISTPGASPRTQALVGSPSVAEAAALLAAAPDAELWVTKQVFRNSLGGVTVAISSSCPQGGA